MSKENKNNFNKLFTDVISTLSNKEYTTIDFKNKIIELFPSVADIFKISKTELEYIDGNEKFSLLIFDNKENNSEFYKYEENISDSKKIIVKYYPEKNYSFSKTELEYIELLNNTIILLYSKLYADHIINNAYKIDSSIGVANNIGIVEFGMDLKKQGKIENYDAVFLNIKDFKFVSRMVGMKNVNMTLKAFIEEISKEFTKDELIGRLGGDNFFALVKKENVDKFLSKLSNIELNINNQILHIKCRIGIYEMQKNDTVEDGIEGASVALLTVRKQKDNLICFFNDEMRQKLLQVKEITYSFEEALVNDEFDVFYQPKVDINTNRLNGAEALVRWTTQSLPPSVFVPILEQENLIEKLDFYVLNHVCNDINKWIQSGIEPVTISTNFSRNNLKDDNLANNIEDIIKTNDINPNLIEVEITESASVDGLEELIQLINKLKKKKIKVSLDDFGTGYSSLSMIKNMNIDTIKIDKSFIDNFDQEKDEIVIRNIIKMINELKINSIVEGVEQKEQVEFLKEIGCNNVQGYYFDKPLKEENFKERLLNKQYCK